MNKRKIGKEKENAAAGFLKKQGYHILEQNFRCKVGEIDLIASDGEYVVFVEVKYRKQFQTGYPEEAVTRKKQRIISKTALWFMMKKGWSFSTPCRFDVIALGDDYIRWYRDAFSFQS